MYLAFSSSCKGGGCEKGQVFKHFTSTPRALIRIDAIQNRLNAPVSVDYKWLRNAYNMNTKSERRPE